MPGLGADKFVVEPGVSAVGLEQAFVGAALDDAALVQYQYEVRFSNRAQPVGDDEGGSTSQQDVEGLLQPGFGDGVDGAGGFIEHDDAGIGQHGAGEANQLALAEGQGGAAFGDPRLQFIGQGFQQVQAVEGGQGGADIGFCGVGAGEADVVQHGAGKQKIILLYAAHLRPQGIAGDIVEVKVVDEDASAAGQV